MGLLIVWHCGRRATRPFPARVVCFLSSRVLRALQFAPSERVGLILELVPRASADRTVLATVLERLERAFSTWVADAAEAD